MNTTNDDLNVALVICEVFREELEAYPELASKFVDTTYFEMGLHDNPPLLRTTLQTQIDLLDERDDVDAIVLAYGICGGGTLGISTKNTKLVVPKAHDCISILMGSAQLHGEMIRKSPGTYFYSPGWIKGRRVPGPDREAWIRKEYADRYDEEMIDELVEADLDAYEHYTAAAYVDIVANTKSKTYCEGCAQKMNWEFKELDGDPTWWESLLSGNWTADRFLVLEPNQKTEMGAAEDLIKAVDSNI